MSNDAYNQIKAKDDSAIKATQVAAYHPFGGRGVCLVIISQHVFFYNVKSSPNQCVT